MSIKTRFYLLYYSLASTVEVLRRQSIYLRIFETTENRDQLICHFKFLPSQIRFTKSRFAKSRLTKSRTYYIRILILVFKMHMLILIILKRIFNIFFYFPVRVLFKSFFKHQLFTSSYDPTASGCKSDY